MHPLPWSAVYAFAVLSAWLSNTDPGPLIQCADVEVGI